MDNQALNTDKEIWREREGDYYADSIFVTERGGIGINCGGSCIVMPIREWFKIAGGDRMNLQQAQELSHKQPVERCDHGKPQYMDCQYCFPLPASQNSYNLEMVKKIKDATQEEPVGYFNKEEFNNWLDNLPTKP